MTTNPSADQRSHASGSRPPAPRARRRAAAPRCGACARPPRVVARTQATGKLPRDLAEQRRVRFRGFQEVLVRDRQHAHVALGDHRRRRTPLPVSSAVSPIHAPLQPRDLLHRAPLAGDTRTVPDTMRKSRRVGSPWRTIVAPGSKLGDRHAVAQPLGNAQTGHVLLSADSASVLPSPRMSIVMRGVSAIEPRAQLGFPARVVTWGRCRDRTSVL